MNTSAVVFFLTNVTKDHTQTRHFLYRILSSRCVNILRELFEPPIYVICRCDATEPMMLQVGSLCAGECLQGAHQQSCKGKWFGAVHIKEIPNETMLIVIGRIVSALFHFAANDSYYPNDQMYVFSTYDFQQFLLYPFQCEKKKSDTIIPLH